MGNCCTKMCGQQSPCQLTEDETKGLLHSSESKTSTKAGTETCTSPVSDEDKWQQETKPALDTAITKQPTAESDILKAQSSYSQTIPILHTEQSLSSKVDHLISLETTPTVAGCLAMETDVRKIEVQDIQNFASEEPQDEVEGPEDDASQVKRETDRQLGSPERVAPVPTDKAGVSSMSQDLTFAPVKEAPVKEMLVKEEPVEEMPVNEAPAEEAPVEEMSFKEAPVKEATAEEMLVKEAPVNEAPAEEMPVKEAPVEEMPVKEAPAEEMPVNEAPVEEMPVVEAPAEEVFEAPMFAWVEAEINLPEVKPETHVSGKKKMLQIGELTPNVTSEVKQEVSLIPDTGEIAVTDNNSTEPHSRISGHLNHHLDATEESVTKVTCEESTLEKPQQEASETQEYSKQVVDITNGLSPDVENGLMKDSNNPSTENKTGVDVTVVEECQKDDAGLKPSEEILDIANEELSSKSSTNTHSAVQVDTNSLTNQEENKDIAHQEQEGSQNGLNSISASAASSPTEKTTPFEPTSDAVAVETTEVEGEVTALKEEKSLEPQDDAEPEPQQREEEIEKQEEVTKEQKEEYQKQGDEIQTQEEDKQKEESDVTQQNEEKECPEKSETQKGGVIFSSGKVEVQLLPVPSVGSVDEVQKLDESADLYLGAEEIEKGASKEKPSSTPVLEFTIPGVESRSSLAPAVDILAYSEREWKGNTAKSALIRKGYSEMARSFSGLKQVRGDNYCALRATLYQVLANSTNTPAWLQDEGFLSLPETIEAREHLIGGWAFPPECTWGSEKDSVERMIYYLDLFKKKWQAAAACESPEEQQCLCDRVFQGGEEEYGLLEALKFLMLAKAIELHGNMVADQEVPVFCWLLFARDTSENPKTLLANHLSQIGFSGGVEQVEMFLLGYALQHTIQAFRLYMTDTVEFVTHYPDDHKHEWPCVCIVTEDDRHYNVPVRNAQHQQGNNITVT
ncbi:uncharacterized protein [Paramisgurnus dabryanus]|uniref:uncharacterized protein n=1 Tax=Paramisgurnus dabryanus TaxID=90735 RepID=UPI0031F389EF